MRTTITAGLLAATLVLAACGSSDSDSGDSVSTDSVSTDTVPTDTVSSDGSSGAPSGDQGRVADLLITATSDQGFELDGDCVNDTVAELSDADAKALADSGLEGDADISAEGDAIGEKIFSECVDAASYLDSLVTAFGEDDATLDTDCLTSALEGKTVDEIEDQLVEAALGCTDGG